MNIPDTQKLDKSQLKDLLRDLKLYRELENELGEQWIVLFNRIKNNTQSYVVEYYPNVTQELAWENAQQIYKKTFSVEPDKHQVEFLERESLKWWIKVYLNDDMVDMSFDKIEKALKGA